MPLTKDKTNEKDSFYELLEQIFKELHKHCIQTTSCNFSEQGCREDI